jgi:hypothetical protein
MSTAESDAAASMRIDPARAKVLAENLEQVIKRVDAVRGSRRVSERGGGEKEERKKKRREKGENTYTTN